MIFLPGAYIYSPVKNMECKVYKVDGTLDVEPAFFAFLSYKERHSLGHGALKPVRFDEVLEILERRDILRSDFLISPCEITYEALGGRRRDAVKATGEGIVFCGPDLDSPLVYLLYRLGQLFFESQPAVTKFAGSGAFPPALI